MDAFDVLEQVGEGAHGIVLRARRKPPLSGLVALKRITLKRTDAGLPDTVLREIMALQHLSHKNARSHLLIILKNRF